jgi:hypothetical protein
LLKKELNYTSISRWSASDSLCELLIVLFVSSIVIQISSSIQVLHVVHD